MVFKEEGSAFLGDWDSWLIIEVVWVVSHNETRRRAVGKEKCQWERKLKRGRDDKGKRCSSSVLRRMKMYKAGEFFFVFFGLARVLKPLILEGSFAFQSGWVLLSCIVLVLRFHLGAAVEATAASPNEGYE